MVATVEMEPMVEKKKKMGRPKTSDRKDGTARIDTGVLSKAQMVAKSRQVSLAEYLTELLRGPVDRDFLKEMKRLESSSADEGDE